MGEVLLSAAHVAYLGPVSGTLRSAVEEEWQELLRAQVRAEHCRRHGACSMVDHEALLLMALPAAAHVRVRHA